MARFDQAPLGGVGDRVAAAVDLTVACGVAAAGAARAGIRDGLGGHVDDGVLADVELIVSELVTNSVRHAGLAAGALLRVGASIGDGIVRLEIDDAGMAGDVAFRTPGEDGGFGLRLVDALAERWGVARDERTCVWAELPARERGPTGARQTLRSAPSRSATGMGSSSSNEWIPSGS
jgi:anti-sigma regulatory factor (Ser/Thr protein kinase)